MKIAIDTSTEFAGIALVQGGGALAEITWRCGQNHTTQLLPVLNFLLEKTCVRIQDTTGIIVARGPGSFNGLRVGIATAKGLAFSLGVPIVGIGTLEVEAYPHAGSGLPVCSILGAGRSEIVAAFYQKKDGNWRQLIPEYITTLDVLCSGINSETIFCGEYVKFISDELRERLGDRAVIPTPSSRLRRAYFLAELGMKRLETGDKDDAKTLQPIYMRRPPITISKKQNSPERR